MANDPFAQYATPVNQPQNSAPSDPFAKYATPVAGAASSGPTAAVSSSDPFSQYAETSGSPNNGQPEVPAQHLYQDSSQPWYKRAWDWANTPLTESLFGLPEDRPGAGGFERGVEHIVSGLTSPLSVALTAATLGTGGFIESAGASALREAGLSATEIADVTKASQTALNTFREVPETPTAIEDAVKASGVDPALWKRGQSILYDNGLTEHDLLQGNMVERGAYQVLRNVVPDLPIAATARAAKTANALLNTGFTLQQLESAAAMSPRFLDALKEGDYDKAAEYGTEAFASGALGVLGASHALHSAGELFKPLLETDKFRPNDEWLAIDRANKEREVQHAVGEQQAINLDTKVREMLGHVQPGVLQSIFGESPEVKAQKNLDLATVFHQVVTGGDRVRAAQWYNALAEAVGLDHRLPMPIGEGRLNDVPRGLTHVIPNGSNDAGEVRVGTDNRPVVWLSPEGWRQFSEATGNPGSGVSYSVPEASQVLSHLRQNLPDSPITDLLEKAQQHATSNQLSGVAAAEVPGANPDFTIKVVGEELQHTRQRELAGGEIRNLFNPDQWNKLHGILPTEAHDYLDENTYDRDKQFTDPEEQFKARVTRVAETAAKFLSGRTMGVSLDDRISFLDEYFKELEAKHGPQARGEFARINDIAQQHVGDIYDANQRLAQHETGSEGVRRLEEGRQGGAGESPNKGFQARERRPNDEVESLASAYTAQHGINKSAHAGLAPLDIALSKRVADAYDEMRHDPDSPETKKAYSALIRETKDQWDAAVRAGYTFEPWTRPGQPYATSEEMAADVRDNKHLYYFPGGDIPNGHPLAGVDPETGETYNNIFRAVHDLFGHAKNDYEFGPRGEENAFLAHNRMYSDEAVPALLSETKGQNSWVNFGKHLRDENGGLPGKGEKGYVAPPDRPFAEQKAGVLPKKLVDESTRPNNGLFSKEDSEEFNKLSKLKLRVGMGDPGSAGLVTGDNEVLTGRDHADLIREAGYKASPKEDLYAKFFKDGGVRIRTAGGTVYVDFMEPNADTWDRVYRSIASVPDANRYLVEYRPLKGGPGGFHTDAYDKDNLVFKLQDLQEGRTKEAPVGSVSYFRGGLASRERTWNYVKKFLPDEASKHDTQEKRDMLVSAFNMMPDQADYRAAAQAGRAGQMWYERSSRAFDALLDSGADFIKPKDKTKFLNFVAALSPVQPVKQNLLMALNLWAKWDKAGRPTDVDWSSGAVKNSSLYRILKGRGNTQGVDLPARMNNSIRALQGEPLSGPKVSAFTTNLGENANRVTNDTWMAVFGDQDPNRINKPAIYDAMTAKVREAAKAEGIAPRQAQAAIWSFIKSLAELSGWGNDRWIPPQEIIKQGLLTPELVGMHSADFADMLQNDPEIREAIRKIGGNLDALDTKLKTYVPGKPLEGPAAVANPQLLDAAGRLEAARSSARIANHLARKTEPRLFDNTEFSPNNGLFSKDQGPKNGLPDNLDEMIRSNVFKNQPKEYQDLVLNSLRRVAEGSLSEKELAASKFIRDEEDRNYEIGSANDILHHYIQDHLHRVYEDTNPAGRVILSDAKGGKFATNVSQAKQRVYDSNITALLKSPKKMKFDPAYVTAQDRAMLIKAAANKQLIDTLRDNFTRASDGRPAVVLSGSGQVVSGANGEDPKTFIDPNRVRKINIAAPVVDQLSKSGDLQRYLEDGTIKDITPYVHPSNIGAAIDRLEEQATRKDAQYDEVGNNKLRTDLMYLKSMLANKDFSGLKDFNDKLEKNYAWNPQDYIALDKQAMKGWNFVTNDSSGHSVFVRSDILAHPEFAQYLKDRLGLEPSDIAKHPIGKALLGAGTRLKQTLLSLSPFHMVQEALRAVMVGVNPFHITGPDILNGEKIDPSDPNSPTIIRKAVEHGFTTGTDYKALQEHSEGLSAGGGGLISKIPGVGKVLSNSLDWYQNFLFKRYIPALKARSVELMFHEYQRLHPEWSVDRAAKAAALHTNDTFGGINWQAMGRSATTQDWGRLLLLAPDWLEAEMRSNARLFNKDDGGLGRAQVAKMALGLWGIARVLNLVTTGKPQLQAPFGLVSKSKDGREVIFSIRTLPTDLLHAAADPVSFIQGRLSPVLRAGTELTTGRDQFGRKLQPSDLWVDVFRNMAPIPLQAVGQAVTNTGSQVGNIGQAVKAVGGTAVTYASPAQKMAADLASSHSEDGPIDPVQMARHRTIMEIEDKVRAGEIPWPDIYRMYASGQLHQDELKKIQDNIKHTEGMDPSLASLYTRGSRLPGLEYLQLYDQMNGSERAALVPLTLQVRKRYLAKAMKNMRPEERMKDPTFLRFLNMVTDQSPF